jgi:hypothetical protein
MISNQEQSSRCNRNYYDSLEGSQDWQVSISKDPIIFQNQESMNF